jgi:hypothetical protein
MSKICESFLQQFFEILLIIKEPWKYSYLLIIVLAFTLKLKLKAKSQQLVISLKASIEHILFIAPRALHNYQPKQTQLGYIWRVGFKMGGDFCFEIFFF